MTDRYLLDGIKVVELATFVFAPAAGTILADFGADVVHIEHPQIGDAYRHLPQLRPLPECEENYCWILTSRGKKSIALDVRREAGHAVAVDLVRGADVFITNLHPSVLEKLGMRYEDVARSNPAADLRARDRLRRPGRRGREAGLRRDRVVGALGPDGRGATHGARVRVRDRGDGRSPEFDRVVRCDRARAVRPRAHRQGPARAHVADGERRVVELDPAAGRAVRRNAVRGAAADAAR